MPFIPFRLMSEAFDPRANLIGAHRLGLALLVVVSHGFPLGLGLHDPVLGWSGDQTDLGRMAVTGFFVLSGLLVVRSARTVPVGRFVWHRVLRVYPAYWVCLVLTALVLAPALHLLEHGDLAGFWRQEPSPLGYVTSNLSTRTWQYGVGDLLAGTPYGRAAGMSVLNGSLWSLRYEVLCYVLVVGLVLAGVVRRRTGLLWAVLGVLVGVTVWHEVAPRALAVMVPVLGRIEVTTIASMAAVFVLGALAACRPDRFVLDGRVAVLAAVVVLVTLRLGGYGVLGTLALGYVVLWSATRRTRGLRELGVRQDWSFGTYLYAFPLQQVLTLTGLPQVSLVAYVVLSAALALLAGCCSWHLVEKHALRLKHARAPWPAHAPRGVGGSVPEIAPSSVGAPGGA